MDEEKIIMLKDFFKREKIKQAEIAERTGISQPQVNRLLAGRDNFGKKTASAWSQAFGFNPMWLMTGDGDMMLAEQPSAAADVLWLPVLNFDTLDIPQLCYYSARKTFVQFGFEFGVPLSVLEYAVGHSPKDAQVRAIYNHFRVLQPQADDAVRKIIAFSLN